MLHAVRWHLVELCHGSCFVGAAAAIGPEGAS